MGQSKDHPSSDGSSREELAAPKLTRRLSLSNLLFRSKSSRRAPLVSDLSQSAISLNEEGSITSIDTSSSVKLRRRRTIADMMGKIFKKKVEYLPVAPEEPARRTHRVSSYYASTQADEEGAGPAVAREEISQPSLVRRRTLMDIAAPRGDRPLKGTPHHETCSLRQGLALQELLSAPKAPDRPIQIITTTRCALLAADQLYQGTLTVSTRDLHFQALAFPARLNFRINHSEIVAILPIGHYGAKGIQVVTQLQSLRFVNIPERDKILRHVMKEWILYCRLMLVQCGTIRRSAAATPVPMPTPTPTPAAIPTSAAHRPLSCGCSKHYAVELARKQIPELPMVLAGFIFGGGLNGVEDSFAATQMRSLHDIQISLTPFGRNEHAQRHRVLFLLLPPNPPTEPLHLYNEQTVIRETADVVVVESVLRPEKTVDGGRAEARVRWCITRDSLFQQSSTVLVTGEMELNDEDTQASLMTTTLREAMLDHFAELLEALCHKITALYPPLPEQPVHVEESRWRRVPSRCKELWIFQILPGLRRLRPRRGDGRRMALVVILSLLIVFASSMLFSKRSRSRSRSRPRASLFTLQLTLGEYQRSAAININRELQETRDELAMARTRLAQLTQDI